MGEIFRIANEKKISVYLAVRADGLSSYEEVREVILKKYPNIKIDGENRVVAEFKSYQLKAKNYQLVFCNFGAPEQETYLETLRSNPGNLRLAIGVGGSFDYLTGKLKRAPKIMRLIGLEWLWRLIKNPRKIGKVMALPKFVWRVLRSKG